MTPTTSSTTTRPPTPPAMPAIMAMLEPSGSPAPSSEMEKLGSASTVMPSWDDASAAVPSEEVSELSTAADVVEAGTAMVAVMMTEAASMVMVTKCLIPNVNSSKVNLGNQSKKQLIVLKKQMVGVLFLKT